MTFYNTNLMKKYFNALLAVLVLLPFFSFSQTQNTEQEIYTLFDEVVGTDNTGIYKGTEYQEKYKFTDKKHPYFKAQSFVIGSLNYEGELYFNLNMRYNLHEQEIILKIQNRNSTNVIIKLFKDKVSGFTIDGHRFVKVSGVDSNNDNIFGFYEVAFSNEIFLLLIKHKKNKTDSYENGFMYAEFINAKNEYIILFKGNYTQIKSKKDIIQLFPKLKEKINNFYKIKKSLRRINYNQFIIELLKEIKLTKLK